MAVILGVNAVFHDPAAALVIDGEIVAAAEEERFSRRKHGKSPVPFSTWELPEQAIAWCLDHADLDPCDLDAIGYSYDPGAAPVDDSPGSDHEWEGLRTLYARRAPYFLKTLLPGLDPGVVHHVRHHVAHAASAWAASPFDSCAVLVMDGRGETTSSLAGMAKDGRFCELGVQALPHSIGLRYEELTEHLGYRRSSDEYKVMAMASYGTPRHLERFRALMRSDGSGGFVTEPVDWSEFAPPGRGDGSTDRAHVDLAASVQARLEELLIETATWLHERTGERRLAMAGGVALNCVANSRLLEDGPFDEIWVQPAAGDAGTALGAALQLAAELGDRPMPMRTAALGPGWDDASLEDVLRTAAVPYERPADLAAEVARALAEDQVVAWFQGRSEFGPRALGHRSLMAHPGRAENLSRLNDVKGREHFRPVAPMVLLERAADVFEAGPIPSPHMLFVHRVRDEWAGRIPAVVHVDGTARAQTVDAAEEPVLHDMLAHFEALTGLPAVVNTSLNTAGRPMVDTPRDALECFGSAPIDLLAIGPFVVRRAATFSARAAA
ncbi:MAG: carbamoyltransferase [Actinomycetota bacterium]|nr:carbamoyltransferase [Actinomycetota bacterium]